MLLKRSPLCRPACNAQSGGRGGGDVRHGGGSSFNSGAAAPWPCSTGPASASESAAARRTEVINWLRARRSSFNSCLPVPSSTGKARRKKSLKHLPIPSFENIQNGEFRIHCAYFWTTQKKFQVHNNNIRPRFARWAFSDESAHVSHWERSQISEDICPRVGLDKLHSRGLSELQRQLILANSLRFLSSDKGEVEPNSAWLRG